MRAVLTHPAPTVVLRLVIAAVFVYAAADKLLDPRGFADAIDNYRLMPDALVNLVAVVLPWVELAVAVCLASGVLVPGAALLSASLLAVFAAALASALARGLDIACGCFAAESSGDTVGWSDLILRVALLLASLQILATSRTVDWPTAVALRRRSPADR